MRLVGAAVPDPHLAGAVLSLGDLPFEVAVLQGVVLDVDRQVVAAGVFRDAPGQSPGDEHPVPLQPEVPVQPSGVVLLDDEPQGLRRLLGFRRPLRRGLGALRLGAGPEVPLRPVLAQRTWHISKVTGRPSRASVGTLPPA